MATGAQDSRFKLVEIDGYRERDVYEADDLEQMAEYLRTKAGLDIDPEEVSL